MSRNKMTKDTVPQDFTLSLAVVDAVPVLFFGASMIVAGVLFKSVLFITGAALCLFAGAAKVIWKIIVVLKKKNIWWMFMQMRTLMPVGMLMMIAGGIMCRGNVDFSLFIRLPAVIFFALGVLGMVMMTVFAFSLDSSDLKSNWIEQLTNGFAQICFFAGLLCTVLR